MTYSALHSSPTRTIRSFRTSTLSSHSIPTLNGADYIARLCGAWDFGIVPYQRPFSCRRHAIGVRCLSACRFAHMFRSDATRPRYRFLRARIHVTGHGHNDAWRAKMRELAAANFCALPAARSISDACRPGLQRAARPRQSVPRRRRFPRSPRIARSLRIVT